MQSSMLVSSLCPSFLDTQSMLCLGRKTLWIIINFLCFGSFVWILSLPIFGPVGWDCRIHQLHFCRGLRHPQWVSWYDTEQSDGEAPVMLKLWGMQSTPSLPSLPGPLLSGVVALDMVLSMGQIELFDI